MQDLLLYNDGLWDISGMNKCRIEEDIAFLLYKKGTVIEEKNLWRDMEQKYVWVLWNAHKKITLPWIEYTCACCGNWLYLR